jgi:GNAT superfamily N-acetyltransferase
MRVREAAPEQFAEVLSVLDAAALRTDAGRIREGIGAGNVLVALAEPESDPGAESGDESTGANADPGPVLGALVCSEGEVTAVAVRPNRRGQGIGAALVAAALRREGRLVAEFDPRVRPFWESLGFDISPIADSDRLRGIREQSPE